MDSNPNDPVPTPIEALQSQWVAEMKEFQAMVWAAERGYKRACGGRPDPRDMDLYDEEARACGQLAQLLGELSFAPQTSSDEARAEALQVLAQHPPTRQGSGRVLEKQLQWALAVIAGDARRHWSSYHPRFSERSEAPGGKNS